MLYHHYNKAPVGIILAEASMLGGLSVRPSAASRPEVCGKKVKTISARIT